MCPSPPIPIFDGRGETGWDGRGEAGLDARGEPGLDARRRQRTIRSRSRFIFWAVISSSRAITRSSAGSHAVSSCGSARRRAAARGGARRSAAERGGATIEREKRRASPDDTIERGGGGGVARPRERNTFCLTTAARCVHNVHHRAGGTSQTRTRTKPSRPATTMTTAARLHVRDPLQHEIEPRAGEEALALVRRQHGVLERDERAVHREEDERRANDLCARHARRGAPPRGRRQRPSRGRRRSRAASRGPEGRGE